MPDTPAERAPGPLDAEVFGAIVEQAPEAIILADRDGAIRVWNRGAEALFGYGAAEAIGRSLDLIIPEHLRRPHWEGFHRAIAAGRTRSAAGHVTTTRSMHKDGSRLYVDLSFTVVTGAAGAVIGALAIGRRAAPRQPAGTRADSPTPSSGIAQ